MSTITLVSMVPSGEAFITRDAAGRLRLHKPVGAGGAGAIDEESAARAVAKHGFEPINRSFEGWVALDEFRQAEAAQATPAVVVDRDALDIEEVHDLLETARRWAAEDEGERARRLVLSLLRVPAVLDDHATYESLLGFLDALAQPPAVPPPSPVSVVNERARKIWRPGLNAAA